MASSSSTTTSGQTFLTRAGSFVKDGNGDLVNAAGYRLMGYSLAPGAPGPVANGTAGLVVVNIGALALQSDPSTTGNLFVNLPSNAAIVTGLAVGQCRRPRSTRPRPRW